MRRVGITAFGTILLKWVKNIRMGNNLKTNHNKQNNGKYSKDSGEDTERIGREHQKVMIIIHSRV